MQDITQRIDSEVMMISSRLDQHQEGTKAEGESLKRQLTFVEEGFGSFKQEVGNF